MESPKSSSFRNIKKYVTWSYERRFKKFVSIPKTLETLNFNTFWSLKVLENIISKLEVS